MKGKMKDTFMSKQKYHDHYSYCALIPKHESLIQIILISLSISIFMIYVSFITYA